MKQQNIFSEEALRQAAGSVGEALLDSLPPSSQCTHEFSPDFLAQMEALLCREQQRRGLRRIRKTAAVAAVALLACLSLWVGVNGYAGGAFASWAKETSLDGILYSFSGVPVEEPIPSCYLTWLPEGCQEVERYEHHSVVSILYQSSDLTNASAPLELIFTYLYLQKSSVAKLPIDAEDYTCKTAEVKGIEADLYLPLDPERPAALIWVDEKAGILFSLYGNLTEADLLQAADSIYMNGID